VSAFLVVPVALLLAGARLVDGRPLPVSIGPFRGELGTRPRQALSMAGAAVLIGLMAVALIWAGYGFRYSAAPGGDPSGRFRIPWEHLLAKPHPARALRELGLDGAQRARANLILSSHGAIETLWTNGALDAVREIRRDVLTGEQGRHLDAILARPSAEFWIRMIEFARGHRLLPEAWIYGFTDVYRRAQVRVAFLNGDFRLDGWPSFFPYTFLVKTPLALLGVILMAVAAVALRGLRPVEPRWNGARGLLCATLPLWVLFSVYWAAAIASHLNIGHRHLLPVYPPLFVLCGAAGYWIDRSLRPPGQGDAPGLRAIVRSGSLALGALLVLVASEAVRFFPNYLAYFNGIVAPGSAFRHVVDSSLDWGQDLPAVRAYVERRPAGEGPIYFSYFGAASPDYYGIRAYPLYSVSGIDWLRRPDWKTLFMAPADVAATLPALRQEWPDHDLLGTQQLGNLTAAALLKKPELLRLGAGTYLISASMLQPVAFPIGGPWGPWNGRYEATYQELSAAVRPLMSGNPGDRMAALGRRNVGEWPSLLQKFEEYRFARLTAFLRQREPDEEINFSILAYHLSAGEIARALDGPPPEMGPDHQAKQMQDLPRPGSD